ncbi:MAG TPA: type VI secretion system tube protein Hcp, partial [Candidatus Kapabacteria bacterium]
KVSVCWVDGGKTAMDDWSQITKLAANTKGAPASCELTITSKPQNTDAAMPVGKQRMHKPISITKEIDKASPLFFSVAAGDVDGDGMVDVVLACRKAGSSRSGN